MSHWGLWFARSLPFWTNPQTTRLVFTLHLVMLDHTWCASARRGSGLWCAGMTIRACHRHPGAGSWHPTTTSARADRCVSPCRDSVVVLSLVIGIEETLEPLQKLKVVLEASFHQFVHQNNLIHGHFLESTLEYLEVLDVFVLKFGPKLDALQRYRSCKTKCQTYFWPKLNWNIAFFSFLLIFERRSGSRSVMLCT